MEHALGRVALLQFSQIESGAEVVALAVEHGRAHPLGHLLEQVAQCQHQAVVQRVALGASGEADHGDFLVLAGEFEMDVFLGHVRFFQGLDYGYTV